MVRERRKRRRPEVKDYTGIDEEIHNVADFDPEIKVVLYGKAGTGKTTLASTFPKPILLIDIGEKGTDSVRDVEDLKVIRVTNWEKIGMLYWYLKKEDHGFKTFVWDTVSQAQDLAIRKHMADHNKTGDAGGWGVMSRKDWGSVSSMLKDEIRNWKDLPDMAAVFIAHDRIFNMDEDEDEDQIDPSVGPRLMPSVATVLNASVGLIGNTFIRENIRKARKLKSGKKLPERRKVEYCLRIGPHAYYTTKVRKPKDREVEPILVNPTYDDIEAFWEDE
jgi:hypothetical protein